MSGDPYPPAPDPTSAEREPLVLDPYEEDLGNVGRMLITAVKLLTAPSVDAISLDPREASAGAR